MIAFVGINLFKFLFGMQAVERTPGQIRRVVVRGRRDHGGKDKAVVGIDGSMFFESVVWGIVLHDPVRIDIP